MQTSIDNRLLKVHEAVVLSYIRSGVPVGSSYVWRNFDIGVSPASIRNLMARLETLRLLRKPHTSAGRIPTEKGYRLYVDRMMKSTSLKKNETASVDRVVSAAQCVDEALEQVSRLLESLSHHVGIAIAPGSESGVITRLETAPVGRDRLLVTMTIEPGGERIVSFQMGSEAIAETACRMLGRLARVMVGKDLDRARREIRNLSWGDLRLKAQTPQIRSSLHNLFGYGKHKVHVFGTGNVVSEIDDIDGVRSVLGALESRDALATLLLSAADAGGATVTIGTENSLKPMRWCSVVRSPYNVGNAKGAVGIIGPLRMEYPRLMALVEYTSRELSRFFAKGGGRYRGATKRQKRRGA